MPLEVYAYRPNRPEKNQWEMVGTVYPGEEDQILSMTPEGRLKFMRVQVTPDDSMATVHTIFPKELIIRPKLADKPDQIVFDPDESENLPVTIKKGESHEIFSEWPVRDSQGNVTLQLARGKLVHK